MPKGERDAHRWCFSYNVVMVGSPGTGKTLLARTVPSILPPLTLDEALEVTKIYSECSRLYTDVRYIRKFLPKKEPSVCLCS